MIKLHFLDYWSRLDIARRMRYPVRPDLASRDAIISAELLSRLPDFAVIARGPSSPIDTPDRCIDSAAAGINGTRSRSRIIVWGNTCTIDTIFYGVYTRHTRVSKAPCCCCCWMHAPTGIRDVQARKRICQDFRDCSKCASRFRILIAPICSLSWCFTCVYRIYAWDVRWRLSAMCLLPTIKP